MSGARGAASIALVALVAPACGPLLGGLDEGTAADAGALVVAPAADAAVEASACGPWLDGFRHRVRFDVDSDEALAGYALELSLDARRFVSAAEMRADGADVRVTAGDGVTVVPHWTEPGVDRAAARVWAKVDLVRGSQPLFVYFGAPTAADTSSRHDVFVDVVDNPTFDQGISPWVAVPATNGGTATLEMHPPRALVALDRAPSVGQSAAGWCQRVTFPPGGTYRVVFDVTVSRAYGGGPVVWIGGVGGTRVWQGPEIVTVLRGIDTGPVPAGSTDLCFGAVVDRAQGEQYTTAEFENVRVRPYAPASPIASEARDEEDACSAP